MTPSLVQHILVAGSGSDALLSALTLKRSFPALAVTLVRDPAAPSPDPVGEITTPVVLQHLCQVAGVHGTDIHLQGRPVWTLGFKALWGARASFFRSFENTFSTGLAGFRTEPGFLAADSGLDACSPATALMAAGKLFPREGPNGFKPIENVTGLTFRPELLDAMLLRACQVAGVQVRGGKVAGFTRGPDTLVLEGGHTLAADLFIDATGSDARLATLAENTAWTDFDDACLCPKAATLVRRRGSEPIRPFTTLETLDAGWRWRVEHDDAIGLGVAWHPDFISDDQACAELVAKAGDPSLVPRVHHWRCGRRNESWTGSVLAIGDASGFVEPLASLRSTNLVFQLNWLLRVLVETGGIPDTESRRLYNRIVAGAWDESRDFHALHYRFHAAGKSPFWQMARETAVPRHHAELLSMFQSVGPSAVLGNCLPAGPGLLGIDPWLAALIGLGVPFRHHPEIPEAERKAWTSQCEQRRQLAKQAVPAELCLGAARRSAKPEPRVPLP